MSYFTELQMKITELDSNSGDETDKKVFTVEAEPEITEGNDSGPLGNKKKFIGSALPAVKCNPEKVSSSMSLHSENFNSR